MGRQTVDESDEENIEPRWKILYALNAQRRPLKPSEVAHYTRMDQQLVESVIGSLENDGLVERR